MIDNKFVLGCSTSLIRRQSPEIYLQPIFPAQHQQRGQAYCSGRDHVITGRQLAAGEIDQRLGKEWRKAAEDRHRNIIAQRHSGNPGRNVKGFGHQRG
jgi:hypothetical protein